MSASNPDRYDERVTCASCRFRYAHVRRFCPICGLPAPEAVLEINHEANGNGLENRTAGSAWRVPSNFVRKRITLVLSTALLIWTVSYATLRGRMPVEIRDAMHRAAASVGATSAMPNTQTGSAAGSNSEKSLPEHVSVPAPKTLPDQIVKAGAEDPVALWNRVRQGSTGAEVALARLYLEGTAVAQSCEQAHVLLLAASRKRDKAADGLLTGSYVQHCQ